MLVEIISSFLGVGIAIIVIFTAGMQKKEFYCKSKIFALCFYFSVFISVVVGQLRSSNTNREEKVAIINF
jgi:hypothetical protein